MKKTILFLALLGIANYASSEVVLQNIHWHLLRKEQGKKDVYQEIDRWTQPPAAQIKNKPRAVISLLNRGPNRTQGVVFNYAISARVVEKDSKNEEAGTWTVPFWTEDRRIAWLKANQIKEVSVDNMLLATYLKRLYRAGFWPNAIKIDVMLEPRAGEKINPPIEKILPIIWEAPQIP